jgi:hypothetical protein
MIRYFVATTGDTGRVALQYLKSLLRISHVRLVGLPMLDLQGPWAACAPLAMTPMTQPFVNVVCCPPALWSQDRSVEMPNLDQHGNVVSHETARGASELYTHGVRNVLLATTNPPAPGPALESARRYEALIVPTLALGTEWQRVQCHPRVIPVPVLDQAAMRAALCPT